MSQEVGFFVARLTLRGSAHHHSNTCSMQSQVPDNTLSVAEKRFTQTSTPRPRASG